MQLRAELVRARGYIHPWWAVPTGLRYVDGRRRKAVVIVIVCGPWGVVLYRRPWTLAKVTTMTRMTDIDLEYYFAESTPAAAKDYSRGEMWKAEWLLHAEEKEETDLLYTQFQEHKEIFKGAWEKRPQSHRPFLTNPDRVAASAREVGIEAQVEAIPARKALVTAYEGLKKFDPMDAVVEARAVQIIREAEWKEVMV